MIIEIGIVAGEIWHQLDKNENATLDDLVESLGRSRELVLMSLGWLSREGHVTLSSPEEGFVATLKRQRSASSE